MNDTTGEPEAVPFIEIHGWALGKSESYGETVFYKSNEVEIIDFICELIAEIERLETELIEMESMVLKHNKEVKKRLAAILVEITARNNRAAKLIAGIDKST